MTIIGENKSEGTTFCSSGTNCYSDNWATFSVKPVKEAFKYFRMIEKSCSCSSDTYLFLGGIELFGLYSINGEVLSNGKRKRGNTCVCKKYSKLPFYFVLLFTIYSC